MPDIFKLAESDLNALVTDSEKSANKILTAGENILSVLKGVADKNATQVIANEVSKIFEACHFQDFTGQRATKLRKYFAEIHEHTGAIEQKEKSFDEFLKEGPQTVTANQEDIDKLFGS